MNNIPDQEAAIAATQTVAGYLRSLTPARVGLGRTGASQETKDLLDFQRCHALARDAVYSRMEATALSASIGEFVNVEVLRLHSAAPDRAVYLQRPDLGRQLDEPSRVALVRQTAPAVLKAEEPLTRESLSFIITDGLSALAVERHALPLLKKLAPLLHDWPLAPLCVVEQGRVAIGDQIGEILAAQFSIVLIGERPGLSSPDSLGAYITWEPRSGRTDAERNCVSNIRPEGLSYDQAAAHLSYYLTEARRRQLTGVGLKEATSALKEG